MSILFDVVRRPIVTEKTTEQSESMNKYYFEVLKGSNKTLVKKSIESIFEVKVEKVNIINVKGKNCTYRGRKGFKSGMKKAVVTLKKGDNIDITSMGGN